MNKRTIHWIHRRHQRQ